MSLASERLAPHPRRYPSACQLAGDATSVPGRSRPTSSRSLARRTSTSGVEGRRDDGGVLVRDVGGDAGQVRAVLVGLQHVDGIHEGGEVGVDVVGGVQGLVEVPPDLLEDVVGDDDLMCLGPLLTSCAPRGTPRPS